VSDFFDTLARDAQASIDNGYYDNVKPAKQVSVSLKVAIKSCKANPVITEIKAASPSAGIIRTNINSKDVAQAMQRGGAVAISVLTEPKHFNGSLQALTEARAAVKLPILMKDIIIDPIQIEAAANLGANAVLLIEALYERDYGRIGINETVEYAHSRGLEVLLETHSETEFLCAGRTNADLIGINNRDLGTLKISLETTQRILEKHEKPTRLVVSESGIKSPADIRYLRGCGADAFLVGSSIMLTEEIESKVREFVEA
jgi:indole-3-glycerol phosphate synthase